MICPYCGYEYDDSEPKCPFCATENTGVAREQQRAVIHTLEQETQNISQNMPGELMKKATRRTTGVFGKIFLAVILLTAAVIAGSTVYRAYGSFSTERNLKKLETFLQAGDYAGLQKYMEDIDSYDSVYEKYLEVSFAYRYLSYTEDDLEWFYDNLESEYADHETTVMSLGFVISDCLNAHSYCTEYLEDQLILENEEALEEIRSQAHNLLTLVLHFSEEEIEEMLAMENYYEMEAFMPYAELSLERME